MKDKYGYSIDRTHTIQIKWTLPIPFDEAKFKALRADKECGWYYITRQFGTTETALYIGKARGFIYKRILQHTIDDSSEPFMEKRGTFYVRFGTVENTSINTKDKIAKHYHLDHFLKTIESELIQDAEPIANKSQKKHYTRWYKFHIINSNINKELLSHIIENKEEINVIPSPDWWKGQLEEI